MRTDKSYRRIRLLPLHEYAAANRDDPIRFYRLPVLGAMYRRRVELVLNECRGGERVLELGYGSGVTFLNLNELYTEIHGLDLLANAAGVVRNLARHAVTPCLLRGDLLHLPYAGPIFDTVIAISVLEHLAPPQQEMAFAEIRRVLKPGGQMIYGVPVDRPLMTVMFRLLGYDIHRHHLSTEKDVEAAAQRALKKVRIRRMRSIPPWFGVVYKVGHFTKPADAE